MDMNEVDAAREEYKRAVDLIAHAQLKLLNLAKDHGIDVFDMAFELQEQLENSRVVKEIAWRRIPGLKCSHGYDATNRVTLGSRYCWNAECRANG